MATVPRTWLSRVASHSLQYLPGWTPTSFGRAVEVKTVPNLTFEDPDVRLADMDGDRRTDVVVTTLAGLAIGYNLSGVDWTQPAVVGVVDPTQALRFSDGHTSLCDVNGDRVQDLCATCALVDLRTGWVAVEGNSSRQLSRPACLCSTTPIRGSSYGSLDGDGWLDLETWAFRA